MTQRGAYPQWYIGAGAGSGKLNADGPEVTGITNTTLDTKHVAYTVRGGWRFSPYAAIELGYYDFGRYNFTIAPPSGPTVINGSIGATSTGLSLVGILPIDQFDLYGRIGYAHTILKFNANITQGTETTYSKDHQDEATYGVGARWTFMPGWALFAEWAKNDKVKIDAWLAGIDFRF
jgi:OOP family OmpA-OmpF porin